MPGLIWIQTLWHTCCWYSWKNFSKTLILKKVSKQKKPAKLPNMPRNSIIPVVQDIACYHFHSTSIQLKKVNYWIICLLYNFFISYLFDLLSAFIWNDIGHYHEKNVLGLATSLLSYRDLLEFCKFRCSKFDPGPVPYFRGDWSWNNFYGHSPPFRWIIQEGLLSVTSESMCTKYWLTACSSLPRKKCG